MPTVSIRVPAGHFDRGANDLLAAGITEACAKAESIPDEPARRIGIWVLIDEILGLEQHAALWGTEHLQHLAAGEAKT